MLYSRKYKILWINYTPIKFLKQIIKLKRSPQEIEIPQENESQWFSYIKVKVESRRRLRANELIFSNFVIGGLLRAPWAARRSNQSVLKEINPEYLLERLMLRLEAPILWPPDVKRRLI